MSAAKTHVQKDWEHREQTEQVVFNIKKIVDFLNKFELSTRHQLAKLDEKLTVIEYQLDYVEASLDGAEGL